MPNFSDILSRAAETIERPPLAPKGTYVFVVTGQPKKQERKEFEVLDFPLRGVAPSDDVDSDDFKEYGGKADNIVVRKSFLFNTTDQAAFDQTLFNMKNFLVEHLGLDPSLSIKELINASVNKKCLGVLDYRADNTNPEIMYHNLGKTAPLE